MKGDRRCISIDSLMPTVLQIICGCSLCGGDIGDGGGMGGDCGGVYQAFVPGDSSHFGVSDSRVASSAQVYVFPCSEVC